LPKAAILACLCATFGHAAHAASFNFCWLGAGGYTMTGTIVFPDTLMDRAYITEDDVTAFKITGYLNGAPVGSWNMEEAGPETTWHLRFAPKILTFPTGGNFGTLRSQGWNANGAVSDCGTPGFGFNAANGAQDVCVNGTFVRDSSIDRNTPFIATTAPVTADCRQSTPLSKR
jgi:hypothetical protein